MATDAATRIMKDGQAATLADLATGEAAVVAGTKNADGSITATRLLVRTASTTNPFLSRFRRGKKVAQ